MCQRCDALRLAWYSALRFSPQLADVAKKEYQACLKQCPQHRQQMAWAASGPPNPPMREDEMEAQA